LFFGQEDEFTLYLAKEHTLKDVTIDSKQQAQADLKKTDKSFDNTYPFEIIDSNAVLTVKSFRQPKNQARFSQFFCRHLK
jgi:hypothetical protein